jgi:mRNA interferase MazF
MPSTTRYKRGDIVLVAFPFTDLSSTKRRPALVVSPDAFNETLHDVVLVALTSQLAGTDGIAIDPTDCVEGILPKRSAVKPSKIFTMHASLVVKKIGAARPEKTAQVLEALRTFFS